MLLANVPGNLLGRRLVQRGWSRGRLIVGAKTVTGLCALGAFSDALPDALRFGLSLLLPFVGGLIPVAVMSRSVVLARHPLDAVQHLRKPMDSPSWPGPNLSDAQWHRQDLQRRRGGDDAVLCAV